MTQVAVTPSDKLTGAWLSEGDSDTHAYVQGNTVVIGHNPKHKGLEFSDPALIFTADGSCELQYRDKDGYQRKPIPPGVAAERIKTMLQSLRGLFPIVLAAIFMCTGTARAQEAPPWAKASRVEALENRVTDLEAKLDKLLATKAAPASTVTAPAAVTYAAPAFAGGQCFQTASGQWVCPQQGRSYSVSTYSAPASSYNYSYGDGGGSCANGQCTTTTYSSYRRPGPVARLFGAGY